MPGRIGERGEGNLGCVLWVAVLVIAVLMAVKMIPVKIASSQLYDFMEEQAKFAANAAPAEIAKTIVNKAKELELPVSKDDVRVERVGDNIRMHAEYTVPIEFPGYTYMWHFDHQVNRPIFIF
jgi:type III secretion system FlhB-like substrate exporter